MHSRISSITFTIIFLFSLAAISNAQYQAPNGISSIAWSPDGTYIAYGGGGRCDDTNTHQFDISIVNSVTQAPLSTLQGVPCGADALAFSPDFDNDSLIVSGHRDSTIRIWNGFTGNELITIAGPNTGILRIVWAPSADRFAAQTGGGIRLFASNGTVLGSVTIQNAQSIDWSPTGTDLVTVGTDNMIRIWDTVMTGNRIETPKTTFVSQATTVTSAVDWGSNGIVTGDIEGNIRVWNSVGDKLEEYAVTDEVREVAWSSDGRQIAVGTNTGTVTVFDYETDTVVSNYSYAGRIQALAWNPTSRELAFGGADGSGQDALVEIEVVNQPPTVNIPYVFLFNQPFPNPVIVTVNNDNFSDDPDGDALTYQWEMDPPGSTGWTVIYTGTDPIVNLDLGAPPPDYCPILLRLTATDPYGASASDTTEVSFTPMHVGQGCTPDF